MNRCAWVFATVAAAVLLLAGCSSKEGGSIDTGKMEASFSTGDPSLQSHAQNAVAAIKGGDYAKAASELKDLADQAKLTPEQKKAVTDVLAAVQQKLAGMTEKAAGEAGKALEGAKQALPK